VLDENVAGISLIDLKRMRSQDQALEIDVRKAFDMLVHIPRITRWTSATNDALPDERAATTKLG
jgi:hypothetical protein